MDCKKDLINEYTLKLTYDYLRKMPPFNRYKLPIPSKIEFEVDDDKEVMGQLFVEPLKLHISTYHQESFNNLVRTTAHEMVHLVLYLQGKKNYDMHDGAFRKLMMEFNHLMGYDKKEM